MFFRHPHVFNRLTPAALLALLAWAMLVFGGVAGGMSGRSKDAAEVVSLGGCAHMHAMTHASMLARANQPAAEGASVIAEKHVQRGEGKDDCCCAHGPIGLLAALPGATFKVGAARQAWLALVPHHPQPLMRRLLRPPLA